MRKRGCAWSDVLMRVAATSKIARLRFTLIDGKWFNLPSTNTLKDYE
jgi:hypothetical protein